MTGYRSEVADGMRIDWDVPLAMSDGVVLRADVYRPVKEGRYPVILAAGPYGKLLHFGAGYPDQWNRMIEQHPDVAAGSTNKYQSFELCDPEKFVPDGYAVVRIDSRGTGTSEGLLIPWQFRETEDLAEWIAWAAAQPWSDGNVGMSGISYLATNQWQVAALQPPALKALCIWEGYNDFYREMCYHGGILSTFGRSWYTPFVLPMQHGQGEDSYKSSMNGEWVTGPKKYTKEELKARRIDWHGEVLKYPLATSKFWAERKADLSKINIPLLSTGNWGGQALHLRGNVEGFLEVPSKEKYLEFHCLEHWTEYYTAYGVDLQRRFFARFLKGDDETWKDQPRVLMQVRHVDGTWAARGENEWPLARTTWTKLYLDAADVAAQWEPAPQPGRNTYRGFSDGVTFMTPPLAERIEITGPIAAKLFVSSETDDADIFVVFRVFRADLKEVTFQGHTDPHATIGQGWLRASHRKLDPEKTLPYRPYHAHDELQKLEPGEIYELDIEVWPTCIVIEPGYRIAVSIRGKDYEYPGGTGGPAVRMLGAFTGVGPFRHDDETNRPRATFDRNVTIHTGPDHPAHLLLPVIPPKE